MPALQPAETRCPPPPPAVHGPLARARREAGRMMREQGLLVPVWSFRIHPVRAIRGSVVELGESRLLAPALASLFPCVTSVAAAACTLGPALEARIASLFASRQRVSGEHARVLAIALDELASERLFTLCDQLHARIVRAAKREGLRTGLPEHPGDPGVALDVQAEVLALSGIEPGAITANASGMLRPLKSLSFLAALGAGLAHREGTPRCARCASRERCSLQK
jgi:hypothetical protein